MVTDTTILDFVSQEDGSLELTDSSTNQVEPLSVNLEDIGPEDIPNVIGKSFDLIKALESQIKQASSSAESAKDKASSAWDEDAGFFNRKNAIEALQSSGRDTTTALVDGIEAQKLSFQLHGQLAEVTKYLFALGVGSIALNRSVVRELEAKLSGASQEELSTLARTEVISVIRQLKAQEDIMSKQEKMNRILKEHDNEMTGLIESREKFDEKLDKQIKTIKLLNSESKEQVKIIKRFEEELKIQSEICDFQSKQLNGLLMHFEDQKQSYNTLKGVLSKKIIIAYVISSIGTLIGITGILLYLLT